MRDGHLHPLMSRPSKQTEQAGFLRVAARKQSVLNSSLTDTHNHEVVIQRTYDEEHICDALDSNVVAC